MRTIVLAAALLLGVASAPSSEEQFLPPNPNITGDEFAHLMGRLVITRLNSFSRVGDVELLMLRTKLQNNAINLMPAVYWKLRDSESAFTHLEFDESSLTRFIGECSPDFSNLQTLNDFCALMIMIRFDSFGHLYTNLYRKSALSAAEESHEIFFASDLTVPTFSGDEPKTIRFTGVDSVGTAWNFTMVLDRPDGVVSIEEIQMGSKQRFWYVR